MTKSENPTVPAQLGDAARWRDLALLAAGLLLLLFWSLQWSDAAPPERFVLWTSRSALLPWIAALHVGVVVLALLGGRLRPLLRLALLSGLALFAVAATVRTSQEATSRAGDDLLSEKLRQLDRIAEDVDTVFIGSSRVYRHLDPVVFDEVRGKQGGPGPGLSFNLGVPDMRMLEVLHLVEGLLEDLPALGLLVVEAEARPLELPQWNRRAARTVRWHDARAMTRIRRGVPQLEGTEQERARLLAAHLEPFERRAAALGKGLDVLRSRPWPGLEEDQRGYQSLEQNQLHPISDEEAVELVERWNRLHERPGDWRRSIERLLRSDPGGQVTDPFEQELFAELEALATERGVEVVWMISPGPTRRPDMVAAFETGVVERLVRFDDPARHPEFYAATGRFDRHHLNREMAKRITTLLAEAVFGSRDLEHEDESANGELPP